MRQNILIMMGILFLAACTSTPDITHFNVPPEVTATYTELGDTYGESLGVELSHCVKDDQVAFEVSGHGGYTGISYYFTPDGDLIDTIEYSDVAPVEVTESGEIVLEEPKIPKIDISEYECTLIMRHQKMFN